MQQSLPEVACKLFTCVIKSRTQSKAIACKKESSYVKLVQIAFSLFSGQEKAEKCHVSPGAMQQAAGGATMRMSRSGDSALYSEENTWRIMIIENDFGNILLQSCCCHWKTLLDAPAKVSCFEECTDPRAWFDLVCH